MKPYHITLIITGSIAAVKVPDLVALLRDKQVRVSIILTHSAQQWLTADAARLLAGQEVLADDSHGLPESSVSELLGRTDAVLVAPVTADFIRQLACNDTSLAQAIHASRKPLFIAPAMNVMMWQHPSTQRNIKKLIDHGVRFLGPVEGNMACGDMGYGRFMEPDLIAEGILAGLRNEAEHPALTAVYASLIERPALPALAARGQTPSSKRILLIVEESDSEVLAIYPLISVLRAQGDSITCAMNRNTQRLLPAEGLATITGNPVYTWHYEKDPQGMEHIRLPEEADFVLFAPVTAEAAKAMVCGTAQQFTGCIYLASKKPVLILPSLSTPPSDSDLRQLEEDGTYILTVPKPAYATSRAYADVVASAITSLTAYPDKGRIYGA